MPKYINKKRIILSSFQQQFYDSTNVWRCCMRKKRSIKPRNFHRRNFLRRRGNTETAVSNQKKKKEKEKTQENIKKFYAIICRNADGFFVLLLGVFCFLFVKVKFHLVFRRELLFVIFTPCQYDKLQGSFLALKSFFGHLWFVCKTEKLNIKLLICWRTWCRNKRQP